MNIPDAIAELGHQIGLPGLALDETGRCRVNFDGDLSIDLESEPGGRSLRLSAPATPLPAGQCSSEVLELLLRANAFGTSTGGAHFSLSRTDGQVLFEHRLDMRTLDFGSFTLGVESFVNHLEGWQMKLAAAA